MNNAQIATTKLDRMKIIEAAESMIQWIINERGANADLAASLKSGCIKKYRNSLWARIFYRNASDEKFWESYCCSTGTPADYGWAETKSRVGWGFQLDGCKTLLNLALASSEDKIDITDIGYSYIKSKFDA